MQSLIQKGKFEKLIAMNAYIIGSYRSPVGKSGKAPFALFDRMTWVSK